MHDRADAAEQSLKAGDPAAALAHLQEQVRAQPGRCQAARLPVPVAVRPRPVGARAEPVERRVDARPGGAGDGADVRRRGELRADAPRGVRGQEVADGPRRARAVARAADRIAAAGRARASTRAVRATFGCGPSTRRRRRAARSTASRSSGSPMPTRGSGPVLEAVINGRYYWVPFSRLTKVALEAPEDLRDLSGCRRTCSSRTAAKRSR